VAQDLQAKLREGVRRAIETVLEEELLTAGFVAPRIASLVQAKTITREEALAKVRAKAFSTFQLIPQDEYEAGLARAERELPETSAYPHEWLIASAQV